MNPIVVSTIIASASIILSIFAANWLNQQHVNKLVDQIDRRLEEQGRRFDAKIDGLREVTEARFETVNATINARFDATDDRLDSIDQRVKRLEDILFKPTLR